MRWLPAVPGDAIRGRVGVLRPTDEGAARAVRGGGVGELAVGATLEAWFYGAVYLLLLAPDTDLLISVALALGLSSELLDKAMVTDLAAGLQSELDSLDRIFSTEDAREGLSALIEGRRPNYIGA